MTTPKVRWHTCPVCHREIAECGGLTPTYYAHNDAVGSWCPMSGEPIVRPETMAL